MKLPNGECEQRFLNPLEYPGSTRKKKEELFNDFIRNEE